MKIALHLVLTLALPILMMGVINRVKARWAGRRGQPYLQLASDLRRLLRKTPVYSETTSWLFPVSAIAIIASLVVASLVTPVIPGFAPASFDFDFIALLYMLAMARVCLWLAALDTGSAFEGMGASRAATLSALTEPALLVALGALLLASGQQRLDGLLSPPGHGPMLWAFRGTLAGLFFLLLLFEGARIPVDDPNTHLELTMIHEVMALDHSGPELAAVQYGAALELTLGAALVARVLNPYPPGTDPLLGAAVSGALMLAVAVLVGLVESVIPRLRLAVLPRLAVAASGVAAAALLALAGARGGLS